MTQSDPANKGINHMENVAIYNEANKGYVTVFTFSDDAYIKVMDTCIDANLLVTNIAEGNKPNSFKFRVHSTKETLNSLLNGS